MAIPSNEYWQARFEQLHNAQIDKSEDFFKRVEQMYRRSIADIEKDTARWYMRLAANNDTNLRGAKKLLKVNELEEFKWTLNQYIKKAKENGISADWSRQLENASAKYHISRLDALKLQVQQHLEYLYGNYLDGMYEAVRGTYQDSFYNTAYELQKGFKTGFEVGRIDEKALEKILAKPWAADELNFSDRLWKDKTKLINTLQNELVQALIRGTPQDKVVRSFADKMNVSLGQAGRLIATETAYFATLAEKESMEKLGTKQYEILATLDRRTSDICRHLDGKVFNVSDFQSGITAPPFHCWCRSCIIPHVKKLTGSKRAARGDDGKTYYIDGSMKYNDWKQVFVDKSMTIGEWRKANNKSNLTELVKIVSNINIEECDKDDIIDIGKQVCELFKLEEKIGNKDALKEVFSNFREMGGELLPEQWARGSNKITKQQLSEAFSYYPKAWVDYLTDSGKKLYTLITNRGFFTEGAAMANGKYYATKFPDYKTGYVSIHMNGMRKTTPYHEIGHYVEYLNKNALRISKEFLKARTKNEKSKQLREILFDPRYATNETTKPDDFVSPYIGKDYPDSSEVLSMGLELIFEPTKQLKKVEFINGEYKPIYATIKDDKEFLYLIIGLILKA